MLVSGNADSSLSAYQTKVGPWGQLLCQETILEAPADYFLEGWMDQPTIWNFPGNLNAARQIMEQAGLESELIEEIIKTSRWEAKGEGMEATLTDEAIGRLNVDQRSAIYPLVYTDQYLRYFSAKFPGGSFARLAPDFPESTTDLVDRFLYRRGGSLACMNIGPVTRSMPDHESRLRMMRALSRTQSYIPTLRIEPNSDFEEIIRYWSAGGRNPRVRSLLRSFQSTTEATSIDLLHLLPPLPRRLLNTYSSLNDRNSNAGPDCWWTGLHFFRNEVSNRALDNMPSAYFLQRDFEEVSPPLQFGDLIVLSNKDTGLLIHAYSYLADDLMFTKNGNALRSPWAIMREENILKIYSGPKTKREIFRSKLNP